MRTCSQDVIKSKSSSEREWGRVGIKTIVNTCYVEISCRTSPKLIKLIIIGQ